MPFAFDTFMDPLSISASIVTLIDATNGVISICSNYARAAKGASWALSKLIDELKSLRNILESLDQLSWEGGDRDTASTLRLKAIYELCNAKDGHIAKELEILNENIRPPDWASKDGSKRRALVQSLTWPLKEEKCKKIMINLERWKSTLQLALVVDQT